MRSFNHTSGQYLKIGDANIYYEVIGNEAGPVLLFLHGALGNIEDFNRIIAELPQAFKIVGIDSRGHGKSTLGSQQLTYELLQKDVETVLKQLNINSLSIIGFSNGGTIAYRLAANSHLKVDKLITIGAPWCTKHIEHLREAFSQLTSESWKAECPSDFESYRRLNPEGEFDALFKQAIAMALDRGLTGRPNESVQDISCPVLVVRGENDPVVSSADIAELATFVKQCQLVSIPSAGHEAFLDQQEVFTKLLKPFLDCRSFSVS